MSGYKNFNFDAFFRAQTLLEKQGWIVFNPAQKDEKDYPDGIEGSETGDTDTAIANGFDVRGAFRWDMSAILNSDAIYMLDGWEHSPGARAEHSLAVVLQKNLPEFQIIYEV